MKKNKLGQHCNEVTQQLFEEGNSNEKQLTLLAEISQNFQIIKGNSSSCFFFLQQFHSESESDL